MNRFKSIVPFTIIGLYAILAIVIILLFDGTGDAGDSVLHYLYAKSAPDHPELFFNHWAKPVFVLLSSPFAQFGFDGMKLFNVLVMILTLFYTFRVTERLELRNGSVALLAIICAPLALALTFSGLTEPLFALFTIAGLHFVLKNQLITACIIISFLPFVRSEGLIIMSAFGLFLLIEKNWKTIPWLLFGHIAYSFAGYFVYEDILWVFTKIPYANIGSPYGSGGLFHFVEQLLYVIGIPIYLLFGIGIIALLWRLFTGKFHAELHVIVLFGFTAFFVAHSLFWYLGIFNSMGLNRVLIGVLPLIAIIALVGFNTLTELLNKWKRSQIFLSIGLCTLIVIFPLTSNPAALNIEKDLNLSTDQTVAKETSHRIIKELGDNHRFIYIHPYISELLDIDHFDESKHIGMSTSILNYLKPGDVIIWENWFSIVECNVTKEMLLEHDQLKFEFEISDDKNGRYIEYAVFSYQENN